jgi:hypothetical protein
MNCANIIEINVAGTIFTTTDQTLNKLNYFRALFQSENYNFPEIIRDKNGRLFLDKDPKMFEIIIRILRKKDFDEKDYHTIELGSFTNFSFNDLNSECADFGLKIYNKKKL